MLLQTTVSGTVDAVQVGIWIAGGLLGLIVVLIAVIWQDNKAQAAHRHNDLLSLINKLDMRQEKIEDRQNKSDKRMTKQEWRMVAMNTALNMLQGKAFDFEIPDSEEDTLE